jgi:hypothetical protein
MAHKDSSGLVCKFNADILTIDDLVVVDLQPSFRHFEMKHTVRKLTRAFNATACQGNNVFICIGTGKYGFKRLEISTVDVVDASKRFPITEGC